MPNSKVLSNKSVSVIVPAFNEEGNLSETVRAIVAAAGLCLGDYEILIFNDGSTDRTGEIAEALAKANERIRVVHNGANRGLGYNYRKGVEIAQHEFVGMIPGDNDIAAESIRDLFGRTGAADIVIAYHVALETRPRLRQILSTGFTLIMNLIFGFNIKYYNGPNVIKRCLLKRIPLTADDFAFMAEALVQLLQRGASYVEVGFKVQDRKYGQSKALKIFNIFNVAFSVARLFFRVNFRGVKRRLDPFLL
ncbi:MAG: glycosyltransferase family 2 protein [Elusimicrobia bacterium]|nr:glycosyltransferase family 2 protein [Elusimicrobiota bacterium]